MPTARRIVDGSCLRRRAHGCDTLFGYSDFRPRPDASVLSMAKITGKILLIFVVLRSPVAELNCRHEVTLIRNVIRPTTFKCN